MMSAKMRVFLSFSGLLRAMRRGTVKGEDLLGAVFYFGCNREHLFPVDPTYRNLDMQVIFDEEDRVEEGKIILETIREMVLQAEAKGWVGFRQPGEHNSVEGLNEILAAAGLPEILTIEDLAYGYNYPSVIRAAEAQGHPAQFFWH
ncbi:MAG: hypothetical protein NTU97_04880 [Candidatus Magasanikbacteria bacterium]|nr:hypothetical protein [Candidatus Magasanikbacteria bacterium]